MPMQDGMPYKLICTIKISLSESCRHAIRPVVQEHRIYLCAGGSHEVAQREAMIYSFFAMCKNIRSIH